MQAYLALENGRVFKGRAIGAKKNTIAEIVFNTGMVGYLEMLTDPANYGQAVVQTFPLTGDYGVITEDLESRIFTPAYIVKDFCEHPSNFRSEGPIEPFLEEHGIVGICDIDTRTLTQMIRDYGVMNCMIAYDENDIDWNAMRAYKVRDALKNVSCDNAYTVSAEGGKSAVVMDFGVRRSFIEALTGRGITVHVVPYCSTAESMLAYNPGGIILPEGPGDPAADASVIAEIKKLCGAGLPIFGAGLGHQMLALAHGFETHKLKYGHRGSNISVKNCHSGKVYITGQNHGYAVVKESIDPSIAKEYFINVNDGTNEGLEYADGRMFSVQFDPETCGNPEETKMLLDRFAGMLGR